MSLFSILLVEDDENDVFFFQRALQKAPTRHGVHVVRDGLEAVAYLEGKGTFADRSHYPLPQLIVLDLNLPHIHGLEVLKWIRSQAPNTTVPVVVLTSSTSELDMFEAYRSGANSFLNKPSEQGAMVELIAVLMRYWMNFNRVPPPLSPERLASARAAPLPELSSLPQANSN